MSARAGRAWPLARAGRARWLAREVVQTSSMDCGPAALKCLLDGFGIQASYGRLREACQTDVDGTSIDTLEVVAQQLGLSAEQVLVPGDHVALPGAADGPAIAVVRHADAATHFIVVWRRVGAWVQVMDPAAGRRWMRVQQLRELLYQHEAVVDAADWRAWAASDENQAALQQRLLRLGVGSADAAALRRAARADAGWLSLAALDAALRLVHTLVLAGGLRRGDEAARLLRALCERCMARPRQRHEVVPAAYWAVSAEDDIADRADRLRLRGAVLLRVQGLRGREGLAGLAPLSAELAAALAERPEPLINTLWWLLRKDGRVTPAALMLAVSVTTAAVALQLLLFRGLFDLSAQLAGSGQRLAAGAALLGFLALLPLLELPIARESLRLGRHLDLRLRAALLHKLPRLHDRYFQSRPISDMADRSHGIQLARGVPATALAVLQALLDLLLTLAGIAWLAPASAGWALAMAVVALVVPLASVPLLAERDLRVRTLAAALAGFYLDALLGLVPVRAHRAQRAVQREHEGLLVAWASSLRGWIRGSVVADGVQGLACIALAGGLVVSHFSHQGGVAGSDLLLVFWTLKLPALGHRIAALAQVLPAQRNALRRLLEPLTAPETALAAALPAAATPGLALRLQGASVRAGGHEILRGLDLQIGAGEQVAVVGVSGAGKSSLLGALLGWHRLSAGTLQVDGREMAVADLESLRAQIAWVDPAVQLWNRSLLDNLLYAADDDALSRVGDATDAARLREVAAKLPQGLQTLLGEGGGLLSGGEGQRVRLARALLQPDARLVLLDEPFRGLDRTQRHALLAEARRWWQGRTLLCVTHDVGETLAFDRVLVVEGGRIVEDGAPATLAAAPSRYRDLLAAEDLLRQQLWAGDGWRRLTLHDGRLHEAVAGRP